jgi:iron complex outermembrane receptor protein
MNTSSLMHPPDRSGVFSAGARRLLRRLSGRLLGVAVATGILLLALPASAQPGATGAIEGRVKNAATGEYLNNARIAVKGTTLMTFTDPTGTFHLANVPAGAVTLRVFFTDLDEREVAVTVPAGQTVLQELALGSKARYGTDAETVKLDTFVVQSTRETNASAIAVNEQRFRSNITSVVSTDEFGTQVDKNPGEILKYLPGVDVESFANNITGVSVRGLGANNTELNFDGMPVASMNAEGVGRGFEVQFSSAADIARVEIRKVPLPEDSSNSLGGAINMIRRSAFEYSKRKIAYGLFFQSDNEKLTLRDMDGPKDRLVPRWQPNWELSWIEPLSKNLGFAVTLGQNNTVVNTHWSLPGWNLGSTANNTAAQAAVAAGLPYNHPSMYTPAIQNPLNHNAPKMQGKGYASVRVDWRPQPELILGWSLSGTDGWIQNADDIRYQWNAAATGSGDVARFNDRNTSLGRPGGGAINHASPLWRDVYTPGLSSVLDARWHKGAWTVGAKGGLSSSRYNYYDTEHGFFNSTTVSAVTGLTNVPETGVGSGTANPIPLTINYSDIGYWGVKKIDAFTTANGLTSTDPNAYTVPVEWWKNSAIRIGGARSRPGSSKEIFTAAKTFVKRDFNFTSPVSLQLGFDYSERYRNRHYDSYAWRFVGADGLPNTADDSATLIAADHLPARRDSQYDYPAIERISMTKLYKLYQDHPGWFQFDAPRSARLTLTQNAAYDLTETVTAPYLQFDSRLLRNRLRLTGGVRYEKSEAEARGLWHQQSDAYQKYSDGTVRRAGDVVGANGLPTTRAGAPVYLPGVTQGSLVETGLTYAAKGARGQGENHNYFPSLHASYNLTENLALQAAYAKTQSKLDFTNVIVPSNDVSDTIVTSGAGTGALGTITIRNPRLKPEVVDNFETRISYFNQTGGLIGFGLFRKNITDFQVAASTPPMTAADLVTYAAQFPDAGIGPEYAGYSIASRFNGGSARLDGVELELRQSLDRVLPHWARGFLIRGSTNYTNRKGANAGDLGNERAWRATAALSFRSRKLSAMVGYNMNGELIENGNITSNGISGKQVLVRQHIVDFNLTYRLTRGLDFYVAAKNLLNELRAREQRYPGRPEWSSMTSSNTFGGTFTVGVTGSFSDLPFRLPWNR